MRAAIKSADPREDTMVKVNGNTMDGRRIAHIIRNQPGYSCEGEYQVTRTINGGYRLYKAVSGRWMDASLADCIGLARYAI